MNTRLRALLVHGMGNAPAWWDPLLPALAQLGITPVPLELPALEAGGPEAWVREVVRLAPGAPTLLMGHSLGAAVCLQAALQTPVAGLVMLACPPFFDDFAPAPPRTHLPLRTVARVARFLRETTRCAGQLTTEAVHLVGAQDVFVPVQQARRLLFPLVVVPAAGHELNQAAGLLAPLVEQLVTARYGRRLLDPGTRLRHLARPTLAALELDTLAPPPARLDIEITTRCQLACPLCARTLRSARPHDTDMEEAVFGSVMTALDSIEEIIFVGLGEPLLHPHLARFVARAARATPRTKLVTNGLLATPATLARLRDAGLAGITFSLDSTDPARFRHLRGGAALGPILENFRNVPAGLTKSIFVTLSQRNLGDLPGLIDLAVEAGLPAVALSDVNFVPNLPASLASAPALDQLAEAIDYAHRKKVLLVSPHFHDFDDTLASILRCRVRRPADVAGRCVRHTHCLAPWRIAVVGVTGEVTPCNCAPAHSLGNLARATWVECWNGAAMQAWRTAVLQGTCADCLACPRY